ncbi:MAG: M20/M25/M40 family metallo-hydrolase [Ktedonobacteraceae bacterium]
MQKNRFVERAEQVVEPLLADLAAIVNIDSGTFTKVGVDQVGAYLQRRFHDFGFATYFDAQEEYGDNLVATRQGTNSTGPRLLLIGHIDTVFPAGEVARRPYAVSERAGVRIAKGPGVLDMKSGVLMGMYALRLLQEEQLENYQSVTFICNSDEEIGSLASKALIRKLAPEMDAVLVLEPGRMLNAVVSSRKGIGRYRVEVTGLSSHAGVEPDKGRNAILELAHQVIGLQALNNTILGATVNVGIIHGGERTNVVPDFAYCELDARVTSEASLHVLEEAMRRVTSRTLLDGTTVTLSGGMMSMPFERTERSARLVELVREVGAELGLAMEDISSGGASDANTASALGLPTLDGLGAAGGLAHNPDEYIELDTLPTRLALLTGLLQRICSYYQDGNKL